MERHVYASKHCKDTKEVESFNQGQSYRFGGSEDAWLLVGPSPTLGEISYYIISIDMLLVNYYFPKFVSSAESFVFQIAMDYLGFLKSIYSYFY